MSFELRDYQKTTIDRCWGSNSIIVLPAGSGKTIIAASLISRHKRQRPKSKILFIVPSRIMIVQQSAVLRHRTNLRVAHFEKGTSFPHANAYDILVTTPVIFLEYIRHKAWPNFSIVIFDEVHHCVNFHPYRTVARYIRDLYLYQEEKQNARNKHQNSKKLLAVIKPRILGLTASLSCAVGSHQIERAVVGIMDELEVIPSQIILVPDDQLDGFSTRTLNFIIKKSEFKLLDQSSTLMYLLHEQRSAFHPITLTIFDSIKEFEREVKIFDSEFISPVTDYGSMGAERKVAEWSKYPMKRLATYANPPEEITILLKTISHLYEAMRILSNSHQEAIEIAIYYLKLSSNFDNIPMIQTSWSIHCSQFTKFTKLKEILLKQHTPSFHGIIFVEQQIVCHIMDFFINNDPELSTKFTQTFLSTSTFPYTRPRTPKALLSPALFSEKLEEFSSNRKNLLIVTPGFEGILDLSTASCVIRFDAIERSGISIIQQSEWERLDDRLFVSMEDSAGEKAFDNQSYCNAFIEFLNENDIKRKNAVNLYLQSKKFSKLDWISRVELFSRYVAHDVEYWITGGSAETLWNSRALIQFDDLSVCGDGYGGAKKEAKASAFESLANNLISLFTIIVNK